MRHLGGYTWESILEEEVPKTMLSIEFLNREKAREQKEYEKAKRKKR